MRKALSLLLLLAACGDDADIGERARERCEDVYYRTDFCLADIGCQGAVSRGVYVDQCLAEGLSDAERDDFVASSCESVNAGSCLADAAFYRGNCACEGYTRCGPGTQCTSQVTGDAICLDDGSVPAGASACDSGNLCQAGWVCAVPTSQTTAGRCVQLCVF
ncbi:MAG: hypothetical protein ACAI38_16865 [Myxococcota bacterium]